MSGATDYGIFDAGNTAVGLRADLVFTPDLAVDPPCYQIEDRLRGKFFRVGLRKFTCLSNLDGRATIAEAVGRSAGPARHPRPYRPTRPWPSAAG